MHVLRTKTHICAQRPYAKGLQKSGGSLRRRFSGYVRVRSLALPLSGAPLSGRRRQRESATIRSIKLSECVLREGSRERNSIAVDRQPAGVLTQQESSKVRRRRVRMCVSRPTNLCQFPLQDYETHRPLLDRQVKVDILAEFVGFAYYQLLLSALHSFSWESYYWQTGGLLTQC